MVKDITCPYCNKSTFGLTCENHGEILVSICFGLNMQTWEIFISNVKIWKIDNHKDFICVDLEKNLMFVYKDYKKVAELLIDNSLTPENYENKLKTYLTFL